MFNKWKEKRAEKKAKKVVRYSKIIVAIVIFLNVFFAAAVLWIYKDLGTEPSSLIVAWFAFTSTELVSLALLHGKEQKNETELKLHKMELTDNNQDNQDD